MIKSLWEENEDDDKDPLVFDVVLTYVTIHVGTTASMTKPTISMERRYTYVVNTIEQLNEALKLEPATIEMNGSTCWLDEITIEERAYP
jgi:hypothetical protein